jgi:hypothetical protein
LITFACSSQAKPQLRIPVIDDHLHAAIVPVIGRTPSALGGGASPRTLNNPNSAQM